MFISFHILRCILFPDVELIEDIILFATNISGWYYNHNAFDKSMLI